MLKRFWGCVREFKTQTFITLFFIVLEAVIEALIPFITASMINKIEAGAVMSDILKTGGTLAVMAVLSLCCGGIAGFSSAKASAGFARNLRHDMFEKIQSFSFSNIDKFSSASLVTRMTTDIENVRISYMMLIRIAVRAPMLLIFSIIMAYIMGGVMATSFIVLIPVLAVGLFLISRKAMPAFRAVFRKYDLMNESVEENIRGMRVVKGFAREEYEKKKFEKASRDIRNDFTTAERIVALCDPLMQFCVYANLIFVLSVGSKLIISTSGAALDIGHISGMLTYGMQILMQLMMLSMIYVTLTMSSESMRRIIEVLDEKPSIVSPANAVTEIADGSVEFDNVSFKYSEKAEKNALEGVNLRIESGMTVGILGGTGSSKSSLVQLIPRRYDVTEGSVRVGGGDVREYDIHALRNAVAMVLQKNLLFSGTISENLRWGDPNATDDDIAEAATLAQAKEFVSDFKEKYDKFIEQGGTNVSGGQKQRLCIARALLKKPKILILDDSTSAVDTRTDALIREGFNHYIPETTKIIIAQRVSSVMESDLIIIMDNGRIVATGKHDDLLSSCDIYREIYEQQMGGGKNEEN